MFAKDQRKWGYWIPTVFILIVLLVGPGVNEGGTEKPVLHGRHWVAITGKPLGATAGARIFEKELKFENFHYIDAEELFLKNLAQIEDPEEKRRIIGHTFIEIFEKKGEEIKINYENITFFAQVTIFPDRVESR